MLRYNESEPRLVGETFFSQGCAFLQVLSMKWLGSSPESSRRFGQLEQLRGPEPLPGTLCGAGAV